MRLDDIRGVTKGGKVGTIPRASSHYGGAEWLRGALNSPNIVASSFFNTVHLLPKDPRFERGDAKLASCPGRHLTLLRPCITYLKVISIYMALRRWRVNRKRPSLASTFPAFYELKVKEHSIRFA